MECAVKLFFSLKNRINAMINTAHKDFTLVNMPKLPYQVLSFVFLFNFPPSVVCSQRLPAKDHHQHQHQRLIGGQLVTAEDNPFSYFVVLATYIPLGREMRDVYCAGSLIRKRQAI